MTIDRPDRAADSYSPQLRTALVLTGTGTAGAYHAGVLRALHEAGVKIDVVAGRGIGAVGALFAAVDGAQSLWDEKGFWRAPVACAICTLAAGAARRRLGAGAAVAIVALPLARDGARSWSSFRSISSLKMVGCGGVDGLVGGYLRLTTRLSPRRRFRPGCRASWCWCSACAADCSCGELVTRRAPAAARRGLVAGAAGAALVERSASRDAGGAMWDLMRGAAQLKAAVARCELGRRYIELVAREPRAARDSGAGDRGSRPGCPPRPGVRAGRGTVGDEISLRAARRSADAEAGGRRSFDLAGVAATISRMRSRRRLSVPLGDASRTRCVCARVVLAG